jgi:NADH dehydrogenase
MQDQPHVVIVGGGFGGLYCGRALRRAPVRVSLVDRRNHHVFQPLLYEVATAALSPAEIAEPIRRVLARQRNAEVLLGEAIRIDTEHQRVELDSGSLDYDYLVLATGMTHSYFGHDTWRAHAPGLKTIDDALEIRRRFLLAFEQAEREANQDARRAALTFVVIGAGPTGVELAGTMSEIARRTIPRDFRSIDTTTARVILVECDTRVLPTYDPGLSEKAKRHLEKLGVEVRTGQRATVIDEAGVVLGEERIDAENVFWAAGVQATPITKTLGVELTTNGRVPVRSDLSIDGHENVFVIGDLAASKDPQTGDEVPGVAPAAVQMGRYVAGVVHRRVTGRAHDPPKAFRYTDRGMLATIGRARAVGTIFGVPVSGLIAWLSWALIHIAFLIGFRNRIIVLLQWAWAYIVFQRGARLITGASDLHLRQPMESARSSQVQTGGEAVAAQCRDTAARR